jgi:hypothetical protein
MYCPFIAEEPSQNGEVAAFVFADIGCPKFLAYFVALVQSAVHPRRECTDTQ